MRLLSVLQIAIAAKKINVNTPKSPREDSNIDVKELSALKLGLNHPLSSIKELKNQCCGGIL